MNPDIPGALPSAQFQFILDQLTLRVFWKDKDSRYLGCNKAFAKDAGLNGPAEIIGKTDADLPWASNAAVLRQHDQEVMATGITFESE